MRRRIAGSSNPPIPARKPLAPDGNPAVWIIPNGISYQSNTVHRTTARRPQISQSQWDKDG